MEGLWITVSFVFVFGTLAVVSFALLRMFGGGHSAPPPLTGGR
jgi:hypothetical protein